MMFFSSPSKHCWPWLPFTALSAVYATIDHLNLIGTAVIMLHLFATSKYCCAVSYPSRAAASSVAKSVCSLAEQAAPKLSSSVLQRNQSVLPEQAASGALSLCFLCERNHRLRKPYWKSGKGERWMWTGFGNKNSSREKLTWRGRKIFRVPWC